jgi:hypothetical protein
MLEGSQGLKSRVTGKTRLEARTVLTTITPAKTWKPSQFVVGGKNTFPKQA